MFWSYDSGRKMRTTEPFATPRALADRMPCDEATKPDDTDASSSKTTVRREQGILM